MPELPEVETIRRNVERVARGQRVSAVSLRRNRKLRWPIPFKRLSELVGARLDEIERRGKVLLLHFVGPAGCAARTVLVHLGMSGRLLAVPREPQWQVHEHVRLVLQQTWLQFVDPRRFGSVEIEARSRLQNHPRIANLGPEPLGPSFDGHRLHHRFRRRKANVRDLLILGRVVAGVGNIYANEACFRAGIRPQRAAGRTSSPECRRLADAIRVVLREAIDAGGTTLSDRGYADAEGRPGGFQEVLCVYGREGSECFTCGTPIRRPRRTARGMFYCPRCQR